MLDFERAFESKKVAKSVSDKAQAAARLDVSRGFVTKYEVDSRRLCLPHTVPL